MRDIWQFWIDFTEFRASRMAYFDELIWGKSYIEKRWYGYFRIDPHDKGHIDKVEELRPEDLYSVFIKGDK